MSKDSLAFLESRQMNSLMQNQITPICDAYYYLIHWRKCLYAGGKEQGNLLIKLL